MFKNQTLNVAPAAVMTAGTNGTFALKRAKGSVLQTLVALLFTWEDRIRQRQALREMDARALADMGITPSDVDYETNKPFWAA
ncbi:MAG: DUF1127 domain-containing protein [Nisaea sp.]|jgi:uncharacterized protein YjiS (DUF1127 family)|uniref:DUF1127 domain-containing protein n=1 Tax=Nisaea sp. TaxID=2024842 RepID=UPI001B21C8DA|nr:DUF1127 domain-containing protein [Nisaea sp.]MBO6559147.1 DUF1127 domain-containing protein [Nisaea sp.]